MANNQTFYDSYRWRVKTAPLVKDWNPQCQRLFDDGKQCEHPSEAVHHLADPTLNPKLAFDWHNLVAVCFQHHAGGQPGETQGHRYCATIGPLNQIYRHKGDLLPTWHRDYIAPITADISRLRGTDTNTVGEAKIDAALAVDMDALLEGI